MKLLILLSMVVFSSAVYSSQVSKEDAKLMYNLQMETFSRKEIMLNPSLCALTLEYAKIAEERVDFECPSSRASMGTDVRSIDNQLALIKEAQSQIPNAKAMIEDYNRQIVLKQLEEYIPEL